MEKTKGKIGKARKVAGEKFTIEIPGDDADKLRMLVEIGDGKSVEDVIRLAVRAYVQRRPIELFRETEHLKELRKRLK